MARQLENRTSLVGDQFGPARIKKRLHAVTGLADRRVVLVERDAIDKHKLQVGTEIVPNLVYFFGKEIQKIIKEKRRKREAKRNTHMLSLSFLRIVLRSMGERMIFL